MGGTLLRPLLQRDAVECLPTMEELDTEPTLEETAWPPARAPGSHGILTVCLLVGCLTPKQQASVSQGRICLDNFACRHTEIEVADQTFYLTQSQYTDTGPTSPSADPITPGTWQGSHWIANF